jgi:undecaprenyl-diphosphatase
MSIDARITLALHRAASQTRLRRGLTRFVATYVPALMLAGYPAALWLSGAGPETLAGLFAIAALTGCVARFVVGALIRGAVRRRRPHAAHGFRPLIPQRSYSFPSAHALFFSAFSAAVYAAMPALGAWFLALTVLVCLARIAAGIHYPSDMLAGIAVGLATAWVVLAFVLPLLGLPAS